MTQPSKTPASSSGSKAQDLYQQAVGLHQQGQLDEAEALYRQALAFDNRHAGATQMRGVIRLQKGDAAGAVELIKRSLDFEPRNPRALNNLGNALLELKRYDEAIEALRLAVKVQPESADAQGNLGRALRKRRLYPEAVEAYRKAVELAPDRAGLHSSLGTALAESGDPVAAIASHERAMALAPDRADLRNNVAHAYNLAGRHAEAESSFRQAVALDPKGGEYHLGLGRALNSMGRFDEAIGHYREARDTGAGSTKFELALMFYQNHVLANDPRQSVVDARLYAERRTKGVVPFSEHRNDPDPERPIRLGWVSADFNSHPVGRFLGALMGQLDPAKVEMYAYSEREVPNDPVYQRIRSAIPNWCPVDNMTDEQLAHRVRRDRIDVLVDLSGHTAGNRLGMFAYKPAPVAVTWLGYFATTGFDTIDYVLCNRWLLPENEEDQWVEKPWRLPDTHWSYTVPSVEVAVAPTPALSGGPFTFGSYNNFDKINEPTIALWSRVIKEVPGSRLLLRSSIGNPAVADRMEQGFRAQGLTDEQLVVERVTKNYEEHLASYGLLDIALDPFPYNGGTTTTEALYMGVPVLTRHGDRFVAHLGETNIQSAGMPEWVANGDDEFVAKAKAFASDLEALEKVRQGLRPRVLASRLFNSKEFARDLEDAFRGMWQKWCAEQVQQTK
jgi:protein O-GlcNAc transferase